MRLQREALREAEAMEKAAEEQEKKLKKQAEMKTKEVVTPDLKLSGKSESGGTNIIQAPTSNNIDNSSSNTSTTTPIRQPNYVIGVLAAAY